MKKKIYIAFIMTIFLCFIMAGIWKNAEERKRAQQREEVTAVDLLISIGGDSLRKQSVQKIIDRFEKNNSAYDINVTFVESDTLAFLKLLYAQGTKKYDIVGLREDSVLSALGQGLVYPLDEFLLRDFGFSWLNEISVESMENTSNHGKIYSLPFIKSKLCYYSKNNEMCADRITIWDVLENNVEGKISIPAYVIIKDMLLSRAPGSWETESEKMMYTVNSPMNKQLFYLLYKGKNNGLVFAENYEDAIEDYLEGHVDSLILDESYENKIIENENFMPYKAELMISDSSQWLPQGCNLFLVKKEKQEDYEKPWKVLSELMKEGQEIRNGSKRNEMVTYKRISSQYNPQIQLIVDRVISDFLHGDFDINEMLENLENQIQKIQKNRQ